MDADFSELMQLAADLDSAPKNVAPLLGKALGVTSGKIKKDAQSTVQKRPLLGKAAAGAIDYELHGTSGAVSEMSSEIGYDKDKPGGALGNLIEFGAPNAKKHVLVRDKKTGKRKTVPVPGDVPRPLPPSHDLGNALLKNEDDFVSGVERAIDDAMREAGL